MTVPLVTQELSNECWYASACMLAYYRSPGPRRGLPSHHQANNGIVPADFRRLALGEGLKAAPVSATDLTADRLEMMLRIMGPIWCAGFWDGVGHIVVLTGVENGKVYINDPSPFKGARVETLAWFNQKRDKFADAMLYMPR